MRFPYGPFARALGCIGVNRRPKKEGEKGGVVEISRPLAVSKVALVCPKCGQPTRVGYQLSGKEKLRICRKCKEII